MTRSLHGYLALALASFACACTSEAGQATQVMLEVDAEPSVRARLARLTIDIRGGAASDAYADYSGEPVTDLQAPALPLQIALVPRGGDPSRRYQVTVRARAKDGSFVAEARLISGYVQGSVRFARLVLEDACIDVDACLGSEDEPLTCRAGSCADPRAEARTFSSNRAAPTLIGAPAADPSSNDGGEEDGDAGASGSDAGSTSDAGSSDEGGPAQDVCKLGSSKLSCRLGN